MKEIKFSLPLNENVMTIEGLGVMNYEIFGLPGSGHDSIHQIDYSIETERGETIKNTQLLSRDEQIFSFEHDEVKWIGELQ